ncbi:MAG: VWA domain-containing protein [Deltaproteobacteria bacterium]|nr:VWA domain-containing protein [Deltaproteobacteria bacterium]MBW2537967.1 VWA domain-containing protein [Deltaproteobacteria bacterium]
MSKLLRIPGFLVLAATLLACGGGLELQVVNSDQKKPNNVWVFFTAMEGDEPAGGMTADDFQIYEDDKEVSKFESKQLIQNPEVAAVMYTMLLVDMSGSVSESGEVDKLVDAAKSFSDRVGKHQKVGVYAFDGSEKLHSVTPFTESKGSVEGGIEGLRSFKAKDPSTNLHGAVVAGVRELKEGLDKDKKPLKFGTLVVFTDGTDQAARVSREDMTEELGQEDYEHYQFYAIGVGAEMEEAGLEDIGRDGTVLASDHGEVQKAFDEVAAKVENHMKRFYLLSYCTPARAGTHLVRIEATRKDSEGGESSGSAEYEFNADGFGPPPDCDPKKKPTFDLKAPEDAGPGTPKGSGGASVDASVEIN